MMNIFRKLTLILIVLLVLNISNSEVQALENTDPGCEEVKEQMVESGEATAEEIDCTIVDEPNIDTKKFDITGAVLFENLFLSDDPEIRAKEVKKYYYRFFFHSHLYHYAGEVDDKLLKVDSFTNLGGFITSLIASIFGIITYVVNSITMTLANFYINDYVADSFNYIIHLINMALFDWENPYGVGFIISFIIALFVILRNIFSYIAQRKSNQEITKMIFKVLIISYSVSFSFMYVRPFFLEVSDMAQQAVFEQLDTSDENIEISFKHKIFRTLRFIPFLEQNFDVTTVSELAGTTDKDSEEYKEALSRVRGMFKGDEDALTIEYEDHENKNLILGIQSGFMHIMNSLAFLFHSIMMFIVLGIPLLFIIIINVIEVLAYAFIWIKVWQMMFNTETSSISSFLVNRLQFLILMVVCNLIMYIILEFVMGLVTYFIAIDIMLMIMMELFLCVLFWVAYKNKDRIIESLKILISAVGPIITGDYSVGDLKTDTAKVYSKLTKNEGKTEIDKADIKSTKESKEKDKKKHRSERNPRLKNVETKTKANKVKGNNVKKSVNEPIMKLGDEKPVANAFNKLSKVKRKRRVGSNKTFNKKR